MGMTPQAPCTKNWRKNPVALRDLSVVGRIQAGMSTPDMKAATIIARRRPTNWDRYPIMVPPTQAPVFMMIDAREAPSFASSFWVNMNVV
jgi:hypothetical protein